VVITGAAPVPQSPFEILQEEVKRGDYSPLSTLASQQAMDWAASVVKIATKLAAGDTEAQKVLQPVIGCRVTMPIDYSPRLYLIREPQLPLKSSLQLTVLPGTVLGQNTFWFNMLGVSGSGRYVSETDQMLLRLDTPPDSWTASVLLHELSHANDRRRYGGADAFWAHRWESERRAYELQLRAIDRLGGAAYQQLVQDGTEEMRMCPPDEPTGMQMPSRNRVPVWDERLTAVFGSVDAASWDQRLSLFFLECNLRLQKSDADKEQIIKGLMQGMGD